MQNGEQKNTTALPIIKTTATHNINTAKTLREQIMADMKTDLTKIISQEVATIRTEFTAQITTLSTTLTTNFNTQFAKVMQTMKVLNQRFNEVMECLPTNLTNPTTPAHKKSKGLGVDN